MEDKNTKNLSIKAKYLLMKN